MGWISYKTVTITKKKKTKTKTKRKLPVLLISGLHWKIPDDRTVVFSSVITKEKRLHNERIKKLFKQT